jgi:hypothetical protein
MRFAHFSFRSLFFTCCLALGCEEAAVGRERDGASARATPSAPALPTDFETKLPRLAIARTTRVILLPKGWIVEAVARGLTMGGAQDFYVSGAKGRGFVLASQSDLGNTLALHFERGGERASATLTKIASRRMLGIRLTYTSAP